MEETKKKKLKIISSLLGCVLSLSAMVSLTFSWFAKNDNVSSGGLQVRLADPDSGMSIKYCHSYVCNETGSVEKNNMLTNPSVKMKEYDWVMIDKNDDTPLIFRIIVSNVPSSDTGINITVNIKDGSWSYWGTTANDSDKIISNVLSVKVGFGWESDGSKDSYKPSDSADDSDRTIYNGVKTYLKGNSFTAQTFVNETEQSRTTNLSFALKGYNDYLCEVSSDGTINYDADADKKTSLVFYIMFDYDTELVNSLEKAFSNASDKITFKSDISSITLG